MGHEGRLDPSPHPNDPLVEDAEVAAVLDSSGGRAYLFSVPTAQAECGWIWIEGQLGHQGRPDLSGICGSKEETFWSLGRQLIEGRTVRLFAGRAGDRVARIVVRFDDRTLDVPLTGRWFFAEFARDPVEVVSYDRAGHVVRRTPLMPPRAGRGSPAPIARQVGPAREVLAIDANGGDERVVLEVAPASDGGTCQIVRSNKTPTNRGCAVPTPKPQEIGVSAMQFGGAPPGVQLLVGRIGAGIERLELTYQDGRKLRVPPREGWALYEISPNDYAVGRRPVELVGLDPSGKVVATKRLPWG